MSTRIIILTISALFIASAAFGQTHYSRAKSPSPTPTPSPTPSTIPQQKMAPRSGQYQPKQSPTPPQQMPQRTNQARVMSTPAATPQLIPARKTSAAPIPRGSTTLQKPIAAQQAKPMPTPAPMVVKPTPTPVPPPDVKAYLDRQIATTKDNKFHLTLNGKDVALTPFHVWRQKSTGADSTSTCIDMRSDEGRIYDIDFMTTGAQVSGIKLHKINGETLR